MSNALRMTPEQYAAHNARAHSAVESGANTPLVAVPNKHGAVTAWRGELRFDSKREARAWDALELRRNAGEVTYVQRQVTFTFTCDGVTVGRYRADFVYRTSDGAWHVADAKSRHTALLSGWSRTKKLMRACYGIQVEEI